MYAVTPGAIALEGELLTLLKDELNVKEVDFLGSAEGLVTLAGRPNFRALGPRFQKRSEEAATAIRTLSQEDLAGFRKGDSVEIQVGDETFALGPEDLEVVEEARGGLVVHGDGAYTAALDPSLDDELRQEGLARELVNRIQRLRKDSGLDITDRIALGVFGGKEVRAAAQAFQEFIAGETLAQEYRTAEEGQEADFQVFTRVELDEDQVEIGLTRLDS
jgi:isoleucyl-tRNA synthetase